MLESHPYGNGRAVGSVRAEQELAMALCAGVTRPSIYLYPESVGIPPFSMAYDARMSFLHERIRLSQHHTTNGECADFFLLHNFVGTKQSSAWMMQLMSRVAREYPFFNRTHKNGPVRHFFLTPCDHGPGDCMFDRERLPHIDGAVPWSAIDPQSPDRRVGFLTFNGALGAHNHFQRNVDIRLPAFDTHQCGVYCGIPHLGNTKRQLPAARIILRRYSPWNGANMTSISASAHTHLPRSLRSRRRYRLFWAGRATKHGARGDLFKHHANRSDFLLVDTSGRFPPTATAAALEGSGVIRQSDPHFLAWGMAHSDFCLSPLGQSDGDSDRYLPALLYGCIPVFASKGEVPPFDELLQWSSFSISLPDGARQVSELHALLAQVSAGKMQAMRAAMAVAWPRMLWTSVVALVPGELDRRGLTKSDRDVSYLGESPRRDAFGALIAVLRRRIRRRNAV